MNDKAWRNPLVVEAAVNASAATNVLVVGAQGHLAKGCHSQIIKMSMNMPSAPMTNHIKAQ